jgi:hypothetical protein
VCTISHAIVADVTLAKKSRPSEVHIKEHKYNLTHGLLEKSKLAQYSYKKGHKICWKEVKALQIEPNTRQDIHRICLYISDRPSDQSTQLARLSHLDSRYHSRSQKTPSSRD